MYIPFSKPMGYQLNYTKFLMNNTFLVMKDRTEPGFETARKISLVFWQTFSQPIDIFSSLFVFVHECMIFL